MSPSLWVTIALGVLIAYANGSNDVSKGIATLAGSGVTNYRHSRAHCYNSCAPCLEVFRHAEREHW